MTVTWADIQEWRSDYVNEAQQTIEDALRTAREIVDDLEYAACLLYTSPSPRD